MASSERHKQYLSLMDIQSWELRGARLPATALTDLEMAVETESRVPHSVEFKADRRPSDTQQNVSVSALSSQPPVVSGSSSTQFSEKNPALMSWEQLHHNVLNCQQCELHQTRTQAVFGVGDQNAQWMVVGEAPGADEDKQGEPFVGRAGQLLNNMLHAIGLKREEIYIANVLKCRPPNNRDPKPEEVAQCEQYLKRQVALIRPKIILAVGRIAAHNLLKTDTSLAKLRTKTFFYGETQTPLIVTYHPAYLLRSPREKRKAWLDLQYAISVFNQQDKR